MKTSIKNFYQTEMQNGEFVTFHTDSLAQMEQHGIKNKFLPQIELYRTRIDELRRTYAVYAASELTTESEKQDQARDRAYSAFKSFVKVCLNEDDQGVVDAAERVMFVIRKTEIDTGNPLRLPSNKETASINSLIANLALLNADIELMGAKTRFARLADVNQAYADLQLDRYEEKSEKPSGDTKTSRLAVEEAYRAVADRINALLLLNQDEELLPFVGTHNVTIDNYKTRIAMRKGQNKSLVV